MRFHCKCRPCAPSILAVPPALVALLEFTTTRLKSFRFVQLFATVSDPVDVAFAFASKAASVKVETGFAMSLVLSTLDNPTIALVTPETVPVNAGEAKFAFKFNAVCVAVLTGLLASLVLSTLPNPTIALVTPETVPVKLGEARLAFRLIDVSLAAMRVFKSTPFSVKAGVASVPKIVVVCVFDAYDWFVVRVSTVAIFVCAVDRFACNVAMAVPTLVVPTFNTGVVMVAFEIMVFAVSVLVFKF